MLKDKEYTLKLLKEKINDERKITYREIEKLTGYSKRQLIRLSCEVEKKDIHSLLVHGNAGKPSHNSSSLLEKEYIKTFKDKYPVITISQFMDIYHEDVIFNPNLKDDILKYGLKLRSKSFFRDLYIEFGWKSPIKHKKFGKRSDNHPLRDPSPNRGMLVIMDGTPLDWFNNGLTQSLHLAIDDSTGEILAGWFMPTECLEGYCHLLKTIISKHGIPENFYSDKYSVFYNDDNQNLTQFGRMCDELGINLIFANTPQAKGKVERMNFTLQNRLLNDIKRFNINSIEKLNKWFNSRYINYINKKLAYKPLYDEALFVKPDFRKTDLSLILCRKEQRIILNGNVVSYKNNYYQILDIYYQNYPMFKGTKVTVLEDIFYHLIRVEYKKKIHNTKLVHGHRHDPVKRQTKINNHKDLEAWIDSNKKNRIE